MLILIERIASRYKKDGEVNYTYAIFECPYCHRHFKAPIGRLGRDHSCGCAKNQRIAAARTSHGGAPRGNHSNLYARWEGMKCRCQNPDKENYGGKGIKVCPEWLDFAVFEAWSLANGYEPHLEIDREKSSGDYSPDNCRWVTRVVNNRNRACVKLSIEKAATIRRRRTEGESVISLAAAFSVGVTTVYRVIKGIVWR